jgi:hypothetical protein
MLHLYLSHDWRTEDANRLEHLAVVASSNYKPDLMSLTTLMLQGGTPSVRQTCTPADVAPLDFGCVDNAQ